MHFRECSKCEKYFRTVMKYATICEECRKEKNDERKRRNNNKLYE
jgi:hypothetical protein